MSKKDNLKFLLLGSSGVGKTCLIQQYVNKTFEVHAATVGVGIKVNKIIIDNKVNVIELWDTAGQERFDALGRTFYRGTDCCILVFDVTQRKSFRDINFWRDEFIQHTDLEDTQHFPFAVLGNKADLDSELQVTRQEAIKWCNAKGMPYYETSATDGRNLDEVFKSMVQRVHQYNSRKPTEESNNSITITGKDEPEPNRPQDNNCCNNNVVNFKFWPE